MKNVKDQLKYLQAYLLQVFSMQHTFYVQMFGMETRPNFTSYTTRDNYAVQQTWSLIFHVKVKVKKRRYKMQVPDIQHPGLR